MDASMPSSKMAPAFNTVSEINGKTDRCKAESERAAIWYSPQSGYAGLNRDPHESEGISMAR